VHRGVESAKFVVQEPFIAVSWSAPMPPECTTDLFGFAPVEGREVVVAFDGGAISSDARALLLGATDLAARLRVHELVDVDSRSDAASLPRLAAACRASSRPVEAWRGGTLPMKKPSGLPVGCGSTSTEYQPGRHVRT
jgi:hypothetical protein